MDCWPDCAQSGPGCGWIALGLEAVERAEAEGDAQDSPHGEEKDGCPRTHKASTCRSILHQVQRQRKHPPPPLVTTASGSPTSGSQRCPPRWFPSSLPLSLTLLEQSLCGCFPGSSLSTFSHTAASATRQRILELPASCHSTSLLVPTLLCQVSICM